MKKYLFGVFAIAIAVCFSAFTTKKVNTVYYFNPSNGIVSFSSLTDVMVSNTASWTSSVVSLGTAEKLGAIEFDKEDDEDGPNDGKMTLAEVMDELVAQFNEGADQFDDYDFTVGTGTPTRIQIHKRAN